LDVQTIEAIADDQVRRNVLAAWVAAEVRQ
jgi:hypothetical protein